MDAELRAGIIILAITSVIAVVGYLLKQLLQDIRGDLKENTAALTKYVDRTDERLAELERFRIITEARENNGR